MRHLFLFVSLFLSILPVSASTVDKPTKPLYRVHLLATEGKPLSGIEKQAFRQGLIVWCKPSNISVSGGNIYMESCGNGNLPAPKEQGYYVIPLLKLDPKVKFKKLLIGSVERVSEVEAQIVMRRNKFAFEEGGSGSYINHKFYESTTPKSFEKTIPISTKTTNANPQIISLTE